MKKMLNISLVKSYKDKDQFGIFYIISEEKTKSKIIDSSRLFKSIREINIYNRAIYFNIKNVKIKPIHVDLLAKGLKDCPGVRVRIICGFLSGKVYLKYYFKELEQ